MKKESIKQRIMRCTPEEISRISRIIRTWAHIFNDPECRGISTAQDIIDLLSEPAYLQEASAYEDETGEDYFAYMFSIK